MKLKIFTLATVLLSSMAIAAYDKSNDEMTDPSEVEQTEVDYEDLPQAPEKVLAKLMKECKELAAEDVIPTDTLEQYLLECVNEELDSRGYRMVEQLEPPQSTRSP